MVFVPERHALWSEDIEYRELIAIDLRINTRVVSSSPYSQSMASLIHSQLESGRLSAISLINEEFTAALLLTARFFQINY